MRILLDEQLPRQLVPYFVDHEVRTTQEQGYKNLEFQQNLKASGLIVIVLVAVSNKIEDLVPCVPRALEAMSKAKPGEVLRVNA